MEMLVRVIQTNALDAPPFSAFTRITGGVMSLYQCEKCGAKENTALGAYWSRDIKLCSECSTGEWHGQFRKVILPLGMFVTNRDGNLAHKIDGDVDLADYEIKAKESPQAPLSQD